MKLATLLVTSTVLAACADEPTAIDLELIPDININTPEHVRGAITSLLLVIDSPDGLYPAGAETVQGNLQVRNADVDPDLELVVSIDMPAGRLPSVRLLRGGLPDVALDIRVLGIDSDSTTVAVGRVQGVTFAADRVQEVAAPFNLKPELLPPRVTEVFPIDGGTTGCDGFDIVAIFSKPVAPETVLAAGAFVVEPGGPPAQLGVSADDRVAQMRPSTNVDAYEVLLSTTITDRDGVHLDQIAAQDGDQPFLATYQIVCTGSELLTSCSQPEPGLIPTCPGGSGRLACVSGSCVPTSCDGAACAPGYVCDSVTAVCEVDCRSYGGEACPPQRPRCDDTTGTCVP